MQTRWNHLIWQCTTDAYMSTGVHEADAAELLGGGANRCVHCGSVHNHNILPAILGGFRRFCLSANGHVDGQTLYKQA